MNLRGLQFIAITFAIIALCVLSFRLQKNPSHRISDEHRQHLVHQSDVANADFASLPKTDVPHSQKSNQAIRHLAKEGALLHLPAPDTAPLLAEALERDSRKLPYRFAKALPVDQAAAALAPWKRDGEMAVWTLSVYSPEAASLNFAFDEVNIPPGATLAIRSEADDFQAEFTSRDNEEHGELWTPIFKGDLAHIVATVPFQLLGDFRLRLNKVNYGFRKIGTGSSASCNVDVACGTGDVAFGSLIDQYRDQIRAVGAYTLNGSDTCSGTLINNTNNDNRPFFLTAEHCDINGTNAASMVVYWNFQNSTCRQPGSRASGLTGDGPLSIFNSGAILRALSANSDFCLVELDDPLNSNADAFFAGWDRSGTTPTSTATIHHPSVEEKRISFDYQAPIPSASYSNSANSSGTHWRITDWDQGTTEPGSSGSGLFDQNGRLIGDLTGGSAACGNNLSDWYGRLSVSWSGGGSNSTRLSNWLDPIASGAMTIDGISQQPKITLDDIALSEGNSGSQVATVNFNLSDNSDIPVSFELTILGGTASAGSDYLDPGTRTITIPAGETSTSATFTILGDTLPEENETILLSLQNPVGVVTPEPNASLVILNDDFVTPDFVGPTTAEALEGELLEIQVQALKTPTSYSLTNAPAGMSIDSVSGLITWSAPVVGTYQMDIQISNSAGSDSGSLTLTILSSEQVIALDLPVGVGLSNSQGKWFAQSKETFDGVDAFQVSGLQDNQSASFSISAAGPDELTFWWKTSSEYDYDTLVCDLNGNRIAETSGQFDWHPISITLPNGDNTLTFTYAKDESDRVGFDAAWVDRVTLRSVSPPSFQQNHNLRVPSGKDVVLELSPFFDPADITASNLSPATTFNQDRHIEGNFTSDTTFTATAENRLGQTNWPFTIKPFTVSETLAAALDQPQAIVESTAPAAWLPISTSGYWRSGGNGARSGITANSGTSKMIMHVNGPGTMQFDWKVSSEKDYDFGRYFVNEQFVAEISGDTSWSTQSITLKPGINTITWTYSKDDNRIAGFDLLLVDKVLLSGFAGWVAEQGLHAYNCPLYSGSDGDENQALLEYAVGLSAVTSELPHQPVFTGLAGAYTLSTPINNAATDVTISLEKATQFEPANWFALPTSTTTTALSASDNSGDARSFFRIAVTTP